MCQYIQDRRFIDAFSDPRSKDQNIIEMDGLYQQSERRLIQ